MRKLIISMCLGLSFLMILDSMNAGYALVMFFLAGVVPGTSITIDAASMLEFFTLLIGFTLSRITMNFIRLVATHEAFTYQSS